MGFLPEKVFLFPIQNSLLYRRVTLPYHVFEEKYVAMVKESLRTQTPIAIVSPDKDSYEGTICVSGLPHILNEYPSGELDIYITGEVKCKLIRQHQVRGPYLEYSCREIDEDLNLDESFDLEIESFRVMLEKWARHFLSSDTQRQQFAMTLDDNEILINYCALFLVQDFKTKEQLMKSNSLKDKVWILVKELGPKEMSLSPFLPPLKF